ncbi:MAG: uroporphyrinogen-III synthase [Anaerolineae bacterium]
MAEALRGKRVLLTRPAGQNADFARRLRAAGAIPVEFPTIRIGPPDDPAPLDGALANLDAYDWLIFTSANGVEHFWRRLQLAGAGRVKLDRVRIAVVGPATAAALMQRKIAVDLIPAEHIAEGLLEAIGDVRGQRVLLPAADIARPTLAEGLQAKGAIVDRVVAYQTRPVEEAGDLRAHLGGLDILTFASSSAVRGFAHLLEGPDPATAIGQAVVACLGPATARTARELDLPVHVVPETYTIPGLIEAILSYLEDCRETTHSPAHRR